MTTTIGQMLNQSATLEIPLGEQSVKISPISIGSIYSHFEAKIRSKKMNEVKELSAMLTGKEKMDFMMNIYRDGSINMEELIQKELGSFDGIIQIFHLATKKCDNPIEPDKLQEYITIETLPDYLPAFYFILGQTPPEEEVGEEKSPKKSRKASAKA